MRSGKGRDLSTRQGSHNEGDPLKQRPLPGPGHGWRLPLTRSFPLSFSTSLRKAAAQGDERHWAVQPTVAGGTFLGPTGPVPRVRAPRIPERDCGPVCQSRHRPELSTPRTQCSALQARLGSSGSLGNHGPRPRRYGLGCLTPTEFSCLPDSDGRPTNQGRRSGDP
jgi:hypothetical protein